MNIHFRAKVQECLSYSPSLVLLFFTNKSTGFQLDICLFQLDFFVKRKRAGIARILARFN